MKLVNVQHLRAVAALIVVFHHLVWLVNSFEEKHGGHLWLPRPNGQFGVDIFFVISGFIMVYTAGGNFGAANSGPKFLRNRIIRIVPIYWLATMLEAAILYASHSDDASGTPTALNVIRSLFFIPYGSAPAKMHPVLGVGWTLNCEMFFYVVFAICLTLPRKMGLAALAGTFIAITIAGSLFRFDGAIGFWSSPIILEFLLGAALGVAFRSFDRQVLPAWSTLVAAIVGIAIGAYLMSDQEALGFRPAFWLLAFGIVAVGAFSREPSGFFSRILGKIGDSSYSLYLTHSTAAMLGLTVIDRVGILRHVPSVALFGLTLAGAIVWGLIIHLYVEKPLGGLFRSKRPPVLPLQPAE